MTELCRSCGKPFLPAHGLGGTCSMFLTGGTVDEYRAEIASLKQRLESAEGERGCTCHPDERPPVCQHKYALTDCLNLGAVKKAANLVFRIEAAGAWEYEDGNFERWKAEARRIAPDLRALQEQEKQNG